MSPKSRSPRKGTVYRRASDGRWVAVVDLGVVNGKRRRVVRYAETASEADDKLQDELRKVKAGVRPAGRQATVGDFLTRWLESIRPPHGVRPSTFRRYADLVRLHLIPGMGRARLSALEPTDVDAFLAGKLDSGAAPRSVHHMRSVLRAALGQAVRDGLILRNPAALSRPVRVEYHEMHVLSPEHARRFLEEVRGDRLEALYSTALALGLRQGEALGLRWRDVDLDAGNLRVEHGLQRIGGSLQLIPTKSQRSRRTIVLPGLVRDALRGHRLSQLEERLVAGRRWRDGDFVFTSTIGTPIDAAELRRAFAAILRRAGLPAIRFHDLRHSAASLMLAQGVAPRVVMETLGHSSIALTLDTYTHVLPALQREAADAMDRVLRDRR